MNKNKFLYGMCALFVLFGSCQAIYSYRSYRLTKKMYKQSLDIPKISYLSYKKDLKDRFRRAALKKKNYILNVKEVVLDKEHAYNGSLVKNSKGGYFLFYRKDSMLPFGCYRTSIQLARLDANFDLMMPSKNLTEGFINPEDPRAFVSEGKIFCVFNDALSEDAHERGMRLATFDEDKLAFSTVQDLFYSASKVEKNWTPFYDGIREGVCKFIYQVAPHTIYDINLDNKSLLLKAPERGPNKTFPKSWVRSYGVPRGGAPVINVGEEYLSFFHSSSVDPETNTVWYFAGAYTFEKTYPYRLTKMTEHPILFDEAYSSEVTNPLSKTKRVLYPSGIVTEKIEGRDVLHVSFGENDSAVKIVTFDQERFLASLKNLNQLLNREFETLM